MLDKQPPPPAVPKRSAGRPVDPAKYAAVIEAAQQLFLRDGFAGTSMDTIAAAAGVSKLTVYKRFGNKQALFAEAVMRKCLSMLAKLDVDSFAEMDVRAALIAAGHAVLDLVLSPGAMAVHRLVAAERDRSPELGRLFFDNAIRFTTDKVAALISRHVDRGYLDLGDPQEAARDLLDLLRARPFLHAELGVDPYGSAELAAHIERSVDFALRAWNATNHKLNR